MSDEELERGILTKADRQYLRDPNEYSRQASYARKEKIRERVQRAISTDMKLCANHLPKDITEDITEDITVNEWDTALNAIIELHPDAPEPVPEQIREMASELNEYADRIEQND